VAHVCPYPYQTGWPTFVHTHIRQGGPPLSIPISDRVVSHPKFTHCTILSSETNFVSTFGLQFRGLSASAKLIGNRLLTILKSGFVNVDTRQNGPLPSIPYQTGWPTFVHPHIRQDGPLLSKPISDKIAHSHSSPYQTGWPTLVHTHIRQDGLLWSPYPGHLLTGQLAYVYQIGWLTSHIFCSFTESPASILIDTRLNGQKTKSFI
jgi:hypothetical protein